MTTNHTSGDPAVDELLDSLRAAGVPEANLLDAVRVRLANAVSAEPDWVTHCNYCSALYNGALEHCPRDKRHRVRRIDANSPASRAFVADRRAAVAAAATGPYVVEDEHVMITYTNHRNETAVRRIRPLRMFYGSTEWHPEPQWLLEAHDFARVATRTFAMKNITQWNVYERPE